MGRIAVAHNGIIKNHEALRAELADHEFESQTDTEVVPHLLEKAVADGRSLVEAVEQVTDRLEGSFAIVAAMAGHEGLVGAREDSPLLIGHGPAANYIASDVEAFIEHTREVSSLENGDLAHLTAERVTITHDGSPFERERQTVEWEAEAAQKGGYAHYMLKEIYEQQQPSTDHLSATAGSVVTPDC